MGSNDLFHVSSRHLLNCSLPSWFPGLKTKTFATRIIPLPEEFVEYLKEDGVRLLDTEYEPYNALSEDEEMDTSRIPASFFLQLFEEIRQAICDLGGAVLPKLNWSSPKACLKMKIEYFVKFRSFPSFFEQILIRMLFL